MSRTHSTNAILLRPDETAYDDPQMQRLLVGYAQQLITRPELMGELNAVWSGAYRHADALQYLALAEQSTDGKTSFGEVPHNATHLTFYTYYDVRVNADHGDNMWGVEFGIVDDSLVCTLHLRANAKRIARLVHCPVTGRGVTEIIVHMADLSTITAELVRPRKLAYGDYKAVHTKLASSWELTRHVETGRLKSRRFELRTGYFRAFLKKLRGQTLNDDDHMALMNTSWLEPSDAVDVVDTPRKARIALDQAEQQQKKWREEYTKELSEILSATHQVGELVFDRGWMAIALATLQISQLVTELPQETQS